MCNELKDSDKYVAQLCGDWRGKYFIIFFSVIIY